MKKRYSFSCKLISTLKRTTVLSFVLIAVFFQNANAQSNIDAESNVVVDLSVGSFKSNFKALANAKQLNAESNFTLKDGRLDEVKSFALKMNLLPSDQDFSAHLTTDSLAFELTHVMVLPYMNLVHIVGNMEVDGVSRRTELDFNYSVNEDQSLTLSGTKLIKLSDYKKIAKIKTDAPKQTSEINLMFNLLLKNDKTQFIAKINE
jgi:hypothetical protein